MTNYILKDINGGYLKEFDHEYKRGELTVMTTDINKAYVFSVGSSTYQDSKVLFTDLEACPVKIDQKGTNRKVTDLTTQTTQNTLSADCVAKKGTINSHYKQLAIQPFEYSYKNKLDALQHTIIKYVTRFRDKGGLRDLQAAKVTLDILISFEYLDKLNNE